MAEQSSRESRLWQAVGMGCAVGSVVIFALAVESRRITEEIGSVAMALGLAGAFLLFMGFCCFAFGSVLRILETGQVPSFKPWGYGGLVLGLAGLAIVAVAGEHSFKTTIPTQNQITMGCAGSF